MTNGCWVLGAALRLPASNESFGLALSVTDAG